MIEINLNLLAPIFVGLVGFSFFKCGTITYMKRPKKLVVGNWKMNPTTLEEARHIANSTKRSSLGVKKTQIVLCPPFIYLSSLSKLPNIKILLGAQNAFAEPMGSFTGEVSFSQLHQFKVSFVIIGHSERRIMGETDEMINKKVLSVVNEGMTAVLCIGEKVHDNNGEYLEFIKNQIMSGLKDVSKKLLDHIVIAYEPIWAIGAKEAMSPQDVHEMSIFIKKVLRDMFGTISDSVRILYGGAVNNFNCEDIIKGNYVQGFLVGRESLKPKNFIEIIKIVDKS
jgi:triosephosphate isomerase